MLRLRVLSLAASLALAGALPGWSQTSAPAQPSSKAEAYYHAALAHLYADLAEQYGGRGEYVSKAIDNYKQALRADPNASFLAGELADLYVQTGQVRSAVGEFEDIVRRNPDDLNARRILARFYTARIRDAQNGRMNEDMLKAALDQHRIIAEKAPKDIENLLMLGRLEKFAQNSQAAEKAYQKVLALEPDNEDALTGLALVYSDLGDNQRAAEMLRKVVQKSPNLRTLTALAASYEQIKDYKMAAQTYGQALALNKDNTDLKRAYGEALHRADDDEAARKVFEEVLAEEPNDILSTLRLSEIYRQKKDFDKASQYARKARELDPNNLEIRFNEVTLLEAEGKTSEAISLLKDLLAGMPKNPTSTGDRSNRVLLLERLGILYRSAEQTQQAADTFREIATLDPSVSARASAQIIDALRAGKDFPGAEKEMNDALKKYPDDRVLKTVSASLLADLGRAKEAEAMLKSQFDGKGDRDTWISLAQVYEKAKDFTGMASALDAAEKLSSDNEDKETVIFLRGAMYERMKKYAEAEAEFRKVLALNPSSASALNYLGYMLADQNVRLSEALEMIKQAVDQEPYNSAFLDSLGWVYFRLNRLDEAEDYLRRSLARGSKDPTVHDHLGDVLFGRENLKDAIAQWEISLREWHTSAPSDLDPAEVKKIEQKLESARVRLAKETGGTQTQKR
jgi:tetratricopeptide (TPR) repeat protein